MNQRVKNLREGLFVNKYPLCIEKTRLITEAYKETERQPEVLRSAKAYEKILDNITIFLEDGELIVGNPASKPMGVEVGHLYALWDEKQLEGLKTEGFVFSEEDKAVILSMNEYWKGKTFRERQMELFSEKIWKYVQSGAVLPLWGYKKWIGGGLAASGLGVRIDFGGILADVDKGMVLHGGLKKVIEDAEKELANTKIVDNDSTKKVDFLKAVIMTLKAMIHYAHRFADLAEEMASKEVDLARKKELERIAETCRWVPANPARSFYEAMQSFWFVFLVLNPVMSTSFSRFDQLMYPFYKNDIEKGKITDDEVVELLECLRIKDSQLMLTGGKGQREKWSGLAKWHNCVIGGQTADRKDVTNELTYLILEAAKDCPTPHYTITLRVHEGTPEVLMLKALEVVKTGMGMPAFVGDRAYIEYLLTQGVPLREARDYTIAGCLDVNLTGKSRIGAYNMFIVPRVLEFTLNNGMDTKTGMQIGPKSGEFENFETFDDFMKAFKEQLAFFMEMHAEYNNAYLQAYVELIHEPLDSVLMIDGIKEGKDILDRKVPFENGAVMNAVGMINVVDSMAAIKKLVFEEKKVTKKELKSALTANWHGNGYGEIRRLFLSAPKYGNDDDYVDRIADELYQFWADTASQFDTRLGGKFKPSAISISAQWPGGELTGATPDGRNAGECLADGALSAMRGMDTHGPTALIKSALKVDQVPFQSTLFNMKLHPSALKTTEDMRKLSNLIRTYFSLGGKHIQFNVVGKETLMDAQKRPEKHRDLIVRVAGYSAYFVQLGKVIQDEIIGRTEEKSL